MKRLMVIALLVATGSFSVAQENRISVSWGMGNLMQQDLTVSPMVHKDWSPLNLGLKYSRSGKFEQEAYLRIANYRSSVIEPFTFTSQFTGEELSTYPHNFLLVDLGYAAGGTVLDGDAWKIVFGGRFNNRINFGFYDYGISAITGYYIALSAEAWTRISYQLNGDDRFDLNLGLPIVSWVSRSPWLSFDDDYMEDNFSHNGVRSLINFIKRAEMQNTSQVQIVDLDLTYVHRLSSRWDIGASYRFSLNRSTEPTKFTSLENAFSLAANFKF